MKNKNPYQAHFINFKYSLFDLFRFFGIPFLLWFRVKKIYENELAKKKQKGGCLIISNHILYSDVMVLHCAFAYRRLFFVVMKELFEKPFSRWFYRNSGCIPVDREKPSLSTFKEIVLRLQGGNMIVIFPEGHVSFSNDKPMSPFKSGAIMMAYQANVPIVPTYREIRKNIFQRQKIVIGEPINIKEKFGDNLGMNQIEEVTKYLFDKEQELKELYKRGNK